MLKKTVFFLIVCICLAVAQRISAQANVAEIDTLEEEENDSLSRAQGKMWARFLSVENQKRFFGDVQYRGNAVNLIIVGKVVKVDLTPDDDFYFSKLTVEVEKCVYERGAQKCKEKDRIVVKLTDGPYSSNRVKRGIGPKSPYGKYDTMNGYYGSMSLRPEDMINKRYIYNLTTIPWDIHYSYRPGGLRQHLLPFDSTKLRDIQICKDYYELLLGGDNLVENDSIFWHAIGDKGGKIPLQEAIKKIKIRIKELKGGGFIK